MCTIIGIINSTNINDNIAVTPSRLPMTGIINTGPSHMISTTTVQTEIQTTLSSNTGKSCIYQNFAYPDTII